MKSAKSPGDQASRLVDPREPFYIELLPPFPPLLLAWGPALSSFYGELRGAYLFSGNSG